MGRQNREISSMRASKELRRLLKEMAAAKAKLDKLKAAYAKAKAKL